jgi:hypothetical protein
MMMKSRVTARVGMAALALLVCGQSQANEPLKVFRTSCSGQAKMVAVKDADRLVYQARTDLQDAHGKVDSYQAACGAYGSNPNQDTARVRRLGAQGQEAGAASTKAIQSAEAAEKDLATKISPLKKLGGDRCADAMDLQKVTLRESLKALRQKSQQLANCINQGEGAGGGEETLTCTRDIGPYGHPSNCFCTSGTYNMRSGKCE